TGKAAKGPRARPHGLGAAIVDMARPDRPSDRRARTPARWLERLHRLRLPFAEALQTRQPTGPGRQDRPRSALLDRRNEGYRMIRPRIALYQPDIAGNTGTILRLAACLGLEVHIIEPAGFDLSDRNLKRAGMDYME